jgi:hypothetical protein
MTQNYFQLMNLTFASALMCINIFTREEFPSANEASGFHLDKTTHRELAKIMRKIGFKNQISDKAL